VGNKLAIPAPELLPNSFCANPVGMNLILSQRNFGKCFTDCLVIENRVSKEDATLLTCNKTAAPKHRCLYQIL